MVHHAFFDVFLGHNEQVSWQSPECTEIFHPVRSAEASSPLYISTKDIPFSSVPTSLKRCYHRDYLQIGQAKLRLMLPVLARACSPMYLLTFRGSLLR